MSDRVPVLLNITTGDPRPIVRQIVDGIRRQIIAGDLPVGAALPSVRGLAQQLGINPNTVAKAYAELTTEGWLNARAAQGLFVAPQRQRLSDEEREHRLNQAIHHFVGEVIALDYSPESITLAVSAALQQFSHKKTK
ncbi:GntR family transcriptional regulator [Undibacterium terreum]|uniref:GntR family transcriptional regulator n=1 Tax=Undibacterium terreum TaxID=1224302 RepID=A0A916U9T3_9BURK|nr:GntR family transcriptional regulator [Undibacterium terreum]GGC65851.1 GntR family transcriptional regulator [Undibacterium terreum]